MKPILRKEYYMLDNILLIQGPLEWNIPLFSLLICIIFIYIILLKRFTNLKNNYLQPILFVLGFGLFYLTIGSPISDIIHLSFTLHMIQISMLYFIVPPLILLGIPHHILNPLAKIPKVKQFSMIISSTNLALYQKQARKLPLQAREGQSPAVSGR